MMDKPIVFVVILNWNDLHNTKECLRSLFKSDYPCNVVIVDNGSTDNSVSHIRKCYANVIVIENEINHGYAKGNNLGIRYALENGAKYVWLLNNDAVVETKTLSRMIEYCEENSNIGLLSPIIYYYDNPEEIQFCGSYVDWNKHSIILPKNREDDIDDVYQTGDNTCLWGTALLIKGDVINKIGYLDEKYFAYWEDTEYSLRAIRAGYRNAIANNAKVYHKVSNNKNPYYYYFMARNEYFLWHRYVNGAKKLIYLRQYLSKRLTQYDELMDNGLIDAGNAALDGLWSAVVRVGGRWEERKIMPDIIKKIININPHMWATLLQGKYLKHKIKHT